MYSPINPEAYLKIRAEETRRAIQRAHYTAEYRASQRRRLAKDHHREP